MSNQKPIDEAVEEYRERYKSTYFGKDEDGTPNFVNESALEDIEAFWVAKLTLVFAAGKREQLEEVVKILDGMEKKLENKNDHNCCKYNCDYCDDRLYNQALTDLKSKLTE